MDMQSPPWLSETEMEDPGFINYDQMSRFYDNHSDDSYSPESYMEKMTFIDQSFQSQQLPEIKLPNSREKTTTNKRSISSSNTFTISFGDLNPKDHEFKDALGYDALNTKKAPTAVPRNPIQAQDHVLAERKRREKLNRQFISLSSLLPNLKKMDKASVLEDASNYIKELQGRVKELEESESNKRKNVQESVISIKRSRHSTSDDEYYSSDEPNNCGETSCKICPEIEVRMLGNNVLVGIQCERKFSSLVKAVNKMQELGLCIISSSAMPFAKTTLLITIVAQIEDDFCMTSTEFIENLQLAI